jgi:glycogen synthase
MIGMVGRLSNQMGLDLVERVLDGVMANGCQMVVLGTCMARPVCGPVQLGAVEVCRAHRRRLS